MNPKIVIRSETDFDLKSITEVIVAVFKTLGISNHTEHFPHSTVCFHEGFKAKNNVS